MGHECIRGYFRRVLEVGFVILAVFLLVANGQFGGRFPGFTPRRFNSNRRYTQQGYVAPGQRQYPAARAQRYPAGQVQNRFRASQTQTFNRRATHQAQFRPAPSPTPAVTSQSRYQGTNARAGIQRANTGFQSRAQVARRQRQHLMRKMQQRRHLENKIARQTALIRQNNLGQYAPNANGVPRRQISTSVNRQQNAVSQPSRGVRNQNLISQRTNNQRNNARVPTIGRQRISASRGHSLLNLRNVSLPNTRVPQRLPVIQQRRLPPRTQPNLSAASRRNILPNSSDRQKSTPPRRNVILLVRRPTKQLPKVVVKKEAVNTLPKSRVLMPIPSIVPPGVGGAKVLVSTKTSHTIKPSINSKAAAPTVPSFGNRPAVNTNPPQAAANELFNPFAAPSLFSGPVMPFSPIASLWGNSAANGVPIQLQRMGISHPSMLSPGLQQLLFGDTQDPPDNNTSEAEDGETSRATTTTTTTTTTPITAKPELVNLKSLVDKMLVMLDGKPNAVNKPYATMAVAAGSADTQNTPINAIRGNLNAQLTNAEVARQTVSGGKTMSKTQSGPKTVDTGNVKSAITTRGEVPGGVSNNLNAGKDIYSGSSISGKHQNDISSLTNVDFRSAVPDGVASAAIHTPSVKVTKIDKTIPSTGDIAKLSEVNTNTVWKARNRITGLPVNIGNSNFGKMSKTDAIPSVTSKPGPKTNVQGNGIPTTISPQPATTFDTVGSINSMAAVFAEVLANVKRLWGPAPPSVEPTTVSPTTAGTTVGGGVEPPEMEDIITTTVATTTTPTTTTTAATTTTTTPAPTTVVSATQASCNRQSPKFKCRGRHPFTQMAAMGPWCLKMCHLGQCSLSVCECTCGDTFSVPIVTTTQIPMLIPITVPQLAEATSFHKKSPIWPGNKKMSNVNKKKHATNKMINISANKNGKINRNVNNNNKRKHNTNQRQQHARQRNKPPMRRRPKPKRRTTTTTTVVPTTEEPPEVEEIEWEDIVTTTAVPTTGVPTTGFPIEMTTGYYDTYTTATDVSIWPFLPFMDLPSLSEAQVENAMPADVMWGTDMKAQKQQKQQRKYAVNTTMATPAVVYTTSRTFNQPTTALKTDPPTTPPSRWENLGIKNTPPQQGWKMRERISSWRNRPKGRPSDIPGRLGERSRELAAPAPSPSPSPTPKPAQWQDTTPKPSRWQDAAPQKPSRWQEQTPKSSSWQDPAPKPSRWQEPPRKPSRWQETTEKPSNWHTQTPNPRRWREQTTAPSRRREPTRAPRRWPERTAESSRWREPARGSRERRWRDPAPPPRDTWRDTPVDRWAKRGSNRASERQWADRRPVDRWRDRGPTTQAYWRDSAPRARDQPRDKNREPPSWRSGSHDTWRTGRGRDTWRDPAPESRLRDSWRSRGSAFNRRFGGSLRDQWRETTTPAGEEQEAPEEGDK